MGKGTYRIRAERELVYVYFGGQEGDGISYCI